MPFGLHFFFVQMLSGYYSDAIWIAYKNAIQMASEFVGAMKFFLLSRICLDRKGEVTHYLMRCGNGNGNGNGKGNRGGLTIKGFRKNKCCCISIIISILLILY